ncbi:hypothetical protein LINPERPRIM_LOCUS35584 [Linum perenne]
MNRGRSSSRKEDWDRY